MPFLNVLYCLLYTGKTNFMFFIMTTNIFNNFNFTNKIYHGFLKIEYSSCNTENNSESTDTITWYKSVQPNYPTTTI